jgi:DNA-binding NtrC family response regulator
VEPVLAGTSAAIARVTAAAVRVAASDAAVLIEGETGTGKELVARLVHARSRRRLRAFVSHNAGATPDTLIESELFGHARGAFTGAMRDHPGLFAAADGGTLFLDEIADVSPLMQAKLLRVLQEGEFRRVGEAHARHVDVRLIAATNRPLENEVSAGRFRPDLFYRLHVVTIALPPLRERGEDVALLARHFATRFAREEERPPVELSAAAIDAFRRYAWPGNVRELENEIRRLTALHPGERVGVAELSERVRSAFLTRSPGFRPGRPDLRGAVEALERELIAERLVRFAGNKSRAARDLGLSRQGLAKKMRRYALGWLVAAEDVGGVPMTAVPVVADGVSPEETAGMGPTAEPVDALPD